MSGFETIDNDKLFDISGGSLLSAVHKLGVVEGKLLKVDLDVAGIVFDLI